MFELLTICSLLYQEKLKRDYEDMKYSGEAKLSRYCQCFLLKKKFEYGGLVVKMFGTVEVWQ